MKLYRFCIGLLQRTSFVTIFVIGRLSNFLVSSRHFQYSGLLINRLTFDDMFSGWASKSVADHLGIGIKSGMPYVRHDKASNPFVNLKKEYKGLWWQEIVLRFFMTEVKYSTQADTPSKAYKELASQIRAKLAGVHQYFDKLATAMELWTRAWDKAEENGEINFLPSWQNKTALNPINQAYYS